MQAHLIEVTPARNSNGGIDWTLCNKTNNTCGGSGNYPAVDLGQNTGSQVIVVSISDPSNLGIAFPSKAADALWIQANTKPTGPVIGPPNQIVGVTTGSNTLVFTDKNKGSPITLKYQLNFVGPDNQKVTSIDPDIRNGGGTVSLFGVDVAVAFLIGATVALAIAAMWFRAIAAKRNRAS